jgi:SAM-dependent methyltransferase
LSSVPSRGELYDWEQAHVIGRSDQDLGFYRDLIDPARGSVLELGCGTGRLTIPLLESGAHVVGLDIDPAMLHTARDHHASVPLLCADMCSFAFARPFAVVLAPYNCLQLLITSEGRRACVESVAASLAAGGVFAFEVRDFVDGAQQVDVPAEVLHDAPLGDARVTLHGGLRHDLERRVTTYTRHFEIVAAAGGPAHAVDDDVSLYSFGPGELANLLGSVGLAGRATSEGGVERWVARRIGNRSEPGG